MYKNLLVPVDLSHGDVGARIIRLARELGGDDAKITVLHVNDELPGYVTAQIPAEILKDQAIKTRKRLEELVASIDPSADVILSEGQSANEIMGQAERLRADAIVLGSHRPDYRDYLIGSTAARVVRHAKCSVIVDRGAV